MWGRPLALAAFLAATPAAAETFQVLGGDDDGMMFLTPSSVRDVGSGHPSAELNWISNDGDLEVVLAEFDCAGRRYHAAKVQRFFYNSFTESMVERDGEDAPDRWQTATSGTMGGDWLDAVCGWPGAADPKGRVEVEGIKALVLAVMSAGR